MTVASANVAWSVPGAGGSVRVATGIPYPQCMPMNIEYIEETVRELFEEQHNFT